MDEENHLVMSRDPEWIVVHASAISVDDLVHVCHLLGIVETKK